LWRTAPPFSRAAGRSKNGATHRLDLVQSVAGELVEAGHHVRAELAHPLQRTVTGHGGLGVDVAPGLAGGPGQPGVAQGGVGAAAGVQDGQPLQPGGVAGAGLLRA